MYVIFQIWTLESTTLPRQPISNQIRSVYKSVVLYPEQTWQPIWLWKKTSVGLTNVHVQQTKQEPCLHLSSALVITIVIVQVFPNPWLCSALELSM